MPVKGNQGSQRNQPGEIGAQDTQRTIDAMPEMDPNCPPNSQVSGRENRGGASVANNGGARQEYPFKPLNELERGQHRSPGAPKPPPSEDSSED